MLLSINLDHVATLRNARGESYPSLLEAGRIVEKTGCVGITFHLREDRRHIKDLDVKDLMENFKGSLRMNFEAALTPEMIKIALQYLPHEICLVPEKRAELTTEGGLDLYKNTPTIKDVIHTLKKAGIEVSLFVDPHIDNVVKAKELGADTVELHTGVYANALNDTIKNQEIQAIKDCVLKGQEIGLKINAGHGLFIDNLKPIADIKGIHTLSIGFGVMARSLFIGLENAINEIKDLL